MGKVKQLSIDNEMPDIGSMYPTIRFYKMNGSYLTREEFISQVALCIYDNEPQTNIRETIDLLLKDDMKELVCSGGNTFFSYLTQGVTYERGLSAKSGVIDDYIEEHPLKTYKVSYDILIVPTIPILQRRKTYKRSEETIQATSFREAKEMVKEKLTGLGKVTKSFTVELIDSEECI